MVRVTRLFSVPSPRAARSSTRVSVGRTPSAPARAPHTTTSGLEGAWTNNPIAFDNGYFDNLFGYDWELTRSPAGAQQWTPKDPAAKDTVPDAHDPSKRHAPMMLTSDLALKLDPIYAPISKHFHENIDEFAAAFGKAWYKLLHRDMGPITRFLGPWVPERSALAGPGPGRRPRPDRRRRDRRAQGADPCFRLVRFPAGLDRLGLCGHLPRHRHARRRQRGSHSPGTTA